MAATHDGWMLALKLRTALISILAAELIVVVTGAQGRGLTSNMQGAALRHSVRLGLADVQ